MLIILCQYKQFLFWSQIFGSAEKKGKNKVFLAFICKFSSSQVTLTVEQNEEACVTATETKVDNDFGCEALLQGHDAFINLVKSRLTKLQVQFINLYVP